MSDMQDGSQFTEEGEQGRLAKAALEELAAEKRLADSPVTSQLDGPLDLRHQTIRAEAHRGLDL